MTAPAASKGRLGNGQLRPAHPGTTRADTGTTQANPQLLPRRDHDATATRCKTRPLSTVSHAGTADQHQQPQALKRS
jgi:hypothetical protein